MSSREYKGAQSVQYIRNPDIQEFERWVKSGIIRMVTLAPELPQALELIRIGVRQGIEFSVGHSGAGYHQLQRAVDLGLRHASHTFNGMAPLNHRDPGVLGVVLTDDRIFAQVIYDRHHVHPAVVSLLIRTKGINRVILITDSVRPTGLSDGTYEQITHKIFVKDGVARTAEGRLAGSTLTLDTALRYVILDCNLTLAQALPMVTTVPAQALGLSTCKGSLTPGSDADIVLLDNKLEVRMTIIQGRIVHRS